MSEKIRLLKSQFVRLKRECLDRHVELVYDYDDDDNPIEGTAKKLVGYYPNDKTLGNAIYYYSKNWKEDVFEVIAEYYGIDMHQKSRRLGTRNEPFDTESIEPKHKIALRGFYEEFDKEVPRFFDAEIFDVVKKQHYWVVDDSFNQ